MIPGKLEAAGIRVERHDLHFGRQDTPDTVWMPFVASKGWLAISRNRGQQSVPLERDVAMRSGLALFHLIGPKANHEELGDNLVRTVPRIIAFRDAHRPPFIARVYRPPSGTASGRPGIVRMALSLDEWRTLRR